MAKRGSPFNVDTSPTKKVVVDSLTKDATVEACIFDLIDNSIDAARDTIFSGKSDGAPPPSYQGFHVNLTISGSGFTIEDNCGGISVANLKTMVLRFGERSAHSVGIGIYGVGLNRALFKLGRLSHLKTDTGKQRAELILETAKYLSEKSWELPAAAFATTGKPGTQIEIRELPTEIAQTFADKKWEENLRTEIGRRYSRFIAKKLAITINGKAAVSLEPAIRENGPYERQYKFYKAEDGTTIHIEYGQHSEHRFNRLLKKSGALADEA